MKIELVNYRDYDAISKDTSKEVLWTQSVQLPRGPMMTTNLIAVIYKEISSSKKMAQISNETLDLFKKPLKRGSGSFREEEILSVLDAAKEIAKQFETEET